MLKYPGQETIDFDEVRAAAQGRWPEIFDKLCPLADPVDSIGHRPCACGGTDRLRLFEATQEDRDKGAWHCSQGTGETISGNGFDYLLHARGWDIKRCMEEVWAIVKPNHRTKTNGAGKMALTLVETYLYKGLDGKVKYAVERYVDAQGHKTFRQYCKPDGVTKKYSLKGVPRLPYLLDTWKKPHLGAHPLIYIVEGEKDANRLYSMGHRATCNAGGAGNWQDEITPYIKDFDPIIIEDNDEAGRKHVHDLIAKYQAAGYKRISIICLRDMPKGADISDFLDAGGKLEDLRRLTVEEYLALDEISSPADLPIPLTLASEAIPTLTNHYIVKGLINRDEESVVYGDSNVGKSFVVTDFGLHVSAGQSWRGLRTIRASVIYICMEGGETGIRNRVYAFKQHYPHMASNIDRHFAWTTTTINLMDGEADVPKLIETIQGAAKIMGDVGIVIIDTLARAMLGGNENTAEDMGVITGHVRQIRQATGAHIMLVHHSGKDAARGARGSSALRAATDTEIEITRDEEGFGTIRATKQRSIPAGLEEGFRLDVVTVGMDEDGDEVTSCVVEETDAADVKKTRPLPDMQVSAKKVLHDLIAEVGVQKRPMRDMPYVTVVSRSQFRERLKSRNVTSRDTPATERKQWERIVEGLVNKGIIVIWEEDVWLA